jgi:hypothetical protein
VEPLNGEIDYKKARISPYKFTRELAQQEVLKHEVKTVVSRNESKVQMSMQLTTRDKIQKLQQ